MFTFLSQRKDCGRIHATFHDKTDFEAFIVNFGLIRGLVNFGFTNVYFGFLTQYATSTLRASVNLLHVPCFSLHDNCPEIFALDLKSASLFHGHELLFSMRWRGYLQKRTKNARMAFEI